MKTYKFLHNCYYCGVQYTKDQTYQLADRDAAALGSETIVEVGGVPVDEAPSVVVTAPNKQQKNAKKK